MTNHEEKQQSCRLVIFEKIRGGDLVIKRKKKGSRAHKRTMRLEVGRRRCLTPVVTWTFTNRSKGFVRKAKGLMGGAGNALCGKQEARGPHSCSSMWATPPEERARAVLCPLGPEERARSCSVSPGQSPRCPLCFWPTLSGLRSSLFLQTVMGAEWGQNLRDFPVSNVLLFHSLL